MTANEVKVISKYCRLCAESKFDVISIYGTNKKKFSLETKINTYLPIQVDRADILPLNLCNDCYSTLIAFEKLYINCREAEKKLKRFLENKDENSLAPDNITVISTSPGDEESSKEKTTVPKLNTAPALLSSSSLVLRSVDGKLRYVRQLRIHNPIEAIGEDGQDHPSDMSAATNNSGTYTSTTLKSCGSVPNSNCNAAKVPSNNEAVVDGEIKDEDMDVCADVDESYESETIIDVMVKDEAAPSCEITGMAECIRCKCMVLAKDMKEHAVVCTGKGKPEESECTAVTTNVTRARRRTSGINTKRLKEALGLTDKPVTRKKRPVKVKTAVKINKKPDDIEEPREIVKQRNYNVAGKYTVVDEKYICGMCNKVLDDRIEFKRHRKRDCPFNHFQCTECGFSFKANNDLKNHQRRTCTGKKSEYNCDICGKTYDVRSYFQTHVLYHFAERTIICDQCPLTFKRVDHMRKHQQAKHGQPIVVAKNTRFICSICSAQFSNESRFRMHELKHQGVTSFVCEECGKGFFSESTLKYHKSRAVNCAEIKAKKKAAVQRAKEVRKGEKRYPCQYCGRAFHYPSLLKVHISGIHLKEKPFGCKLCEMRFHESSALARHRARAHTGLKFACPVCPRRVATASDLKFHMESHRSDKPHACPTCRKQFKYKGDMNRHYKKCHVAGDSD